ncbi:fimbria/pilus outer membrane usher protein [Pseudomonas alkylphenolica]|uniref:Fimbrial usher protein, CupC3 family n=1 Tax=Pseudomonas alkylphenolica TaxID=237609 RepID=A0A077FFE0_9PSED|nr:fimbria/pilus outer membrane usher protein [Pseudomonas alkylphenolica]AIL63155.1 fimbrial usher protein, CupC3 family [Pseudomonas alkylphenolica]
MPTLTKVRKVNSALLPGVSCVISLGVTAQAAATEVQFNELFLNKAGTSIDLKYFENGNTVQPGTYNVDIYLNQSLSKRQDINFILDSSTGKVKPIIRLALLEELGVDIQRLEKDGVIPPTADNSQIVDVVTLIKGATVEFEVTRLALEISVPQIYVKRQVRGYVDPSLWDQGLTAFYSDYQANFSRNEMSGNRSDYRYLGLRNGFNFAGWRLRNESALTGSTGTKSTFRSNRSYAEHDLLSLKGKFAVGELYSQGEIFDSVRFRGAQISSDVGMLPDNEIGYAPVVRGIAETNATIEVRQNGYVIYSTSVPPGAFEISDIYPSGSNGDLTIRIIEADGLEREYTQAYSYLPVMTRQGNFRYSLAAGKYTYDGQPSPTFTQGTLVYGLSNNLTMYGGGLTAQDYKAANVGVGVNSGIGGFSFDITNSHSKALQGKTDEGQSARFLYSKTFNATDTSFTMVGYRYSTAGYRTFSQHVDDLTYLNQQSSSRQKSRVDMNINQSLGQRGSMYATLGEASYWNRQGRTRNWQFGYSSSLADASYSIAIARTESSGGSNSDTQLTASLSIPLGRSARTHRVYANALASQHGDSSVQSGVSGYLNERNTLSYSVQAGHSKQSGNSSGIGLGWDTPTSRINGNYNQSRDNKHMDLSAGGSVVVHRDGITFGQPLGETFALIEVPDVSGVGVDSSASIRTNRKGYAVVPYVQPYRYNWINLDTATLDSNTEVSESTVMLVPTRGAIVKARYASEQGRRVQFDLKLDSGQRIPFGAQAHDAQGKALDIVDNLSRLLVFGIDDQGTLELRWSTGACKAEYQLPAAHRERAYERFELLCRT